MLLTYDFVLIFYDLRRYVKFVYFRYVAYKMATSPSYFQQVDSGGGVLQSNITDDIRTHFRTREGVYRLMKLSEYSRPTRSPPNGPNTTPFRIGFVSAPDTYNRRVDDLLAFIVGKELYVYYYNGIRKVRTGLHSVDLGIIPNTAVTKRKERCYNGLH